MKRVVFMLACSLCLFVLCSQIHAQKNIRDSAIFLPALQVSYAYQIPSGDLALRFGNNSNVALACMIKTKSQYLLGVEGSFLFGNLIKENQILNNISTKENFIIAANGQIAQVNLYERGFFTHIRAGKLFPLLSPNVNSGFYFTLGLGLLQHKIRIENVGNTAPQLADSFKKGYDRLSNGVMLSQFLGYSFLSNNRRVNFFAGFEFFQALTQNRRKYNYDSMAFDYAKRKDFLNGFRIGWVIPLYKKLPNEFYYY